MDGRYSHPKCEDPYFSLRRGSYGSSDRANQQRPSNSTSKAGKPALRVTTSSSSFPRRYIYALTASTVSIQAQYWYIWNFESQIRKSSLHITQGNMSNMQQSFNAGQTKGNTQVGETHEACTQGIILSR